MTSFMLPGSLNRVIEGKSRGSGLESRKTRAGSYGQWAPIRWQQRQLGENGVGTLAPTTARCKIGLVGLLRDGSRRSWVALSVPSPRQARNSE
ncbi:hypothetical protein CRG98_021112 [Punica granatum]|uniref:Uncharacterized protein n=1 Tax=Punica granatum TaxID=22663 RepID=A0A2I0JQA7_PUNGR|nr:hypothetical protein CRG98_021112 [Punica granatum]